MSKDTQKPAASDDSIPMHRTSGNEPIRGLGKSPVVDFDIEGTLNAVQAVEEDRASLKHTVLSLHYSISNRHFNTILALLDSVDRYEDAIRKHRDQRGDDRCWMDDEELYRVLPEGFTAPARDSAVELKLCEKYIASCHDPRVEYISPQRRIEELEYAARMVVRYFEQAAGFAPTPANVEMRDTFVKLVGPSSSFGNEGWGPPARVEAGECVSHSTGNVVAENRVNKLEVALSKINDIRNSIIGLQTMNWSEYVYQLVAALDEAGFEGQSYDDARNRFGTMLERTNAAEAKVVELEKQLAEAREEIAIDDKLLADRNRLLDLLPCPVHGQCIPHAMEQVTIMLDALSGGEVRDCLGGVDAAVEPSREDTNARLKADAARWRYVVENTKSSFHNVERGKGWAFLICGETLVEAVDAAMKGEG